MTRENASSLRCYCTSPTPSHHCKYGLQYLLLSLLVVLLPAGNSLAQSVPAETVRGYLWPASTEEFRKAEATVAEWDQRGLTRAEFTRLEQILRAGRPRLEPVPGDGAAQQLTAESPNGSIPFLFSLPPAYSTVRAWPLMVAMHGGPPGSAEQAVRSAGRMLSVWEQSSAQEGWIVLAPAMVSTARMGEYTAERLPYEIFHPEDFRAVVEQASRHFRIDPDRIVSTGISLGSNFSIAYAASHPDWLSAIVPVSTEGESRQALLKNLFAVPTYVLEGTQDRNIRTISGPRAMEAILAREAYDFVYLEMSDRAHEGFTEHYPDVLRWLASRPRQLYPKRVLRSPHAGIAPLSRRVYWVESENAEGMIEARVTGASRIEVSAWNASRVTLYLHDRLVNLDAPIEVRINGQQAFRGLVSRSLRTTLEEARASGDSARILAARISLDVPRGDSAQAVGRRLARSLSPTIPEGQLSFWEMYAVRALEERFPNLGFKLVEKPLPASLAPLPNQLGWQVTEVETSGPLAAAGLKPGDLILRFGDHLSFADSAQDLLFHLRRELRTQPSEYEVEVWRDGGLQKIRFELALGNYREQLQ